MEVREPVGFWKRLAAVILDGIVITATIFIFALIVFGEFAAEERLLQVFEGILPIVYYVLLPVIWTGYTIGKRALGIRVVRTDGSQVGLLTMIVREPVSYILYALTFGIGFIASVIMVIARKDKRALHDLLAKTYVTSIPPEPKR
ncbi:RDD family protein [Alkalicoccus luteus]|uniref:RDD family protein n=1 Tax=Alkalicoccus luteus TaxID=1237094 RepID=A0A969PX35_9BACI|nr:RDD family protein [Alkalicoccus luteus]NJP39064.1 RDD family protein [Alkalicoccus luteus]